MKKTVLITIALASLTAVKAQYNRYNNDNDYSDNGGGFKKENVFIGGSLSLGFGSGSFAVGGNPEIGYSFNKWLDAGVVLNLNYASQKDYYYDVRYSSFNYGAGVFARAWFLPFLFAQAQPELNWISYNTKYSDLVDKQTVNAPSLIGGIGYGQRIVGQGSYFLMLGVDLISDKNSPYVDYYGHAQPIIRGGFDIYLKPSRKPAHSGPIL
ncbi:hypothetical protein [Parafilimonas sp.]|uniref:hypothetical protein n=1 Tax=Parafilimonas sp. TaxID=1969739 RepID=UPI0039E49BA1